MKFANVYYPNGTTGKNKPRGKINIGDSFQWLAIQNIYKLMELDLNDIIQIPKDELGTYDGEEVICPINFIYANYVMKDHMFPFSSKIKPVFLGLSLCDVYLSDEEIEYLKKFAPIGCRDEATCNKLKRLGINAYINGCLTATFPYREEKGQKDIYLVDVSPKLLNYIPKIIKGNIVEKTAILENFKMEEIGKFVSQLYNEYRNKARLVITSRLHTAVPCWAAGIPVIMISEKFAATYSWIEKIIPFYLYDEIETINWDISHKRNVEIKKLMLEVAEKRLKGQEVEEKLEILNDFWEKREKREYEYIVDVLYEKIKTHFSKLNYDEIEYCFWGYTPIAETIYQYLSKDYPQAKLKAFFDRDKKYSFHGTNLIGCEKMKDYKNSYLIICGFTACLESEKILKKIAWEMDHVFMCYPQYKGEIN